MPDVTEVIITVNTTDPEVVATVADAGRRAAAGHYLGTATGHPFFPREATDDAD